MKNCHLPVLLLLLSVATLGQTKEQIIPQTVEFPSGTLHLKAYLWKPSGPGPFPAVLFNHGSGGNEADVTAGMQITESADILAPFFIKHGYAFLYPFRRGHGPSADQAPFMQDVLRREDQAAASTSDRQSRTRVWPRTLQLPDRQRGSSAQSFRSGANACGAE